jgi:Asp-tRNA(Asn)/Glu-tRNA(Gln) amidotransferase A subunit family amidase
LVGLPVVELVRLLRAGEVSSVDLVRSYCERVWAKDGARLCCATEQFFDEAMEQAEEADRCLRCVAGVAGGHARDTRGAGCRHDA